MESRRYKTRLLCLVMYLLWVIPRTGGAQEQKVYEQGAYFKKIISQDSIRFIMQKLGSLRYSSPDSFRSLAELILQSSQLTGYKPGIYDALNKLGLYYRDRGLHDSAIYLFRKAIPYADALPNESKSYILYNNIGNTYTSLGKYGWALESFYRALEHTDKKPSAITPADSTAIYINVGIIWGALKEKEKSLNSFLKAYQLASKRNDSDRLIVIDVNMGILFYNEREWTKSEYYFKQALSKSQVRGEMAYQIYAYTWLSRLYRKWQMYENALTHITLAQQLLERYPASSDIWLDVQATLGSLYLDMGDYAQAYPILLRALHRAREGNLMEKIVEIEPDVARLYATTGNYAKAYEHMQHYTLYKDTMLEYEKGKTLEIWTAARISEKDKALVEQQLHIATQKNQLQNKNMLIAGTIIGILLFALAMVALVRSYRHKQKLQQSTILRLQQEQEINQLKAQVRGEEQERNRIAQELHDGIASQLWAIKLNVDSLQQQTSEYSPQQKSLQTIYQQLEDTTTDVRKTAHNLMPGLLLEEGLATALASLCVKTGKNTTLEVDFMEYGIIPRMDKDIELSLYRMIQELIQNTLKHGGKASQLLVQLSCKDTLLNITVEDNGSGCVTEKTDRGMGLYHIRKRVMALGGHMDFQSAPGKGTTVYLEFDIQHLL